MVLVRIEMFWEFAVYRTEPGFPDFDGCLTFFPDFRHYNLLEDLHIHDTVARALFLV